MSIPNRLTRTVTYPELGLEIELECVFSGERLEIAKMTVQGVGGYIATRDLTQLSLPQVMRAIVSEAVPEANRWSQLENESQSNRLTDPCHLAQIYWLEYVGWGTPRARIMKYMGWSRANANFHIKKINKNFPLPGAHVGDSKE
jgi:hypothetical protein